MIQFTHLNSSAMKEDDFPKINQNILVSLDDDIPNWMGK